jgi:hypothetical protein
MLHDFARNGGRPADECPRKVGGAMPCRPRRIGIDPPGNPALLARVGGGGIIVGAAIAAIRMGFFAGSITQVLLGAFSAVSPGNRSTIQWSRNWLLPPERAQAGRSR